MENRDLLVSSIATLENVGFKVDGLRIDTELIPMFYEVLNDCTESNSFDLNMSKVKLIDTVDDLKSLQPFLNTLIVLFTELEKRIK